MTLRVERFSGSGVEWDACVRGARAWTPFHRWGWKSVIEQVFGHECLYLAARDAGGRVEGVLPLVRVKSLIFGDYLVSMPFVNFGGPLGSDAAVHALVQHAIEIARERRIGLLELRSREAPVSGFRVTGWSATS